MFKRLLRRAVLPRRTRQAIESSERAWKELEMGKSWRTTVFGILLILHAVSGAGVALLDSDPATNPDWDSAKIEVLAGAGLLFARDQKAHDEGK